MPAAADSISGLAGRYATALFELAREHDALDAVEADLEALDGLIAASPDLRRLIRSPVLSRAEQGKAIQALAERADFADLSRRFLGLLAEKRRLFALPEMIRAFRALLAEHRGEVEAELTSAVPLTDQQLDQLQGILAGQVGRTVKLAARVEPRLIGGLVVRVGSRMIDASLRTKLHQLELAMKGAA